MLLLDVAGQGPHHDHQVVTAGEDAVHNFLHRHCDVRDRRLRARVWALFKGTTACPGQSIACHTHRLGAKAYTCLAASRAAWVGLPAGRSGIAGTPSTWSTNPGLPAASLPLIDRQSWMLLPASCKALDLCPSACERHLHYLLCI